MKNWPPPSPRAVRKFYRALCWGTFRRRSGSLREAIGRHRVHRQKMAVLKMGGREAHTDYRVLARARAERRSSASCTPAAPTRSACTWRIWVIRSGATRFTDGRTLPARRIRARAPDAACRTDRNRASPHRETAASGGAAAGRLCRMPRRGCCGSRGPPGDGLTALRTYFVSRRPIDAQTNRLGRPRAMSRHG